MNFFTKNYVYLLLISLALSEELDESLDELEAVAEISKIDEMNSLNLANAFIQHAEDAAEQAEILKNFADKFRHHAIVDERLRSEIDQKTAWIKEKLIRKEQLNQELENLQKMHKLLNGVHAQDEKMGIDKKVSELMETKEQAPEGESVRKYSIKKRNQDDNIEEEEGEEEEEESDQNDLWDKIEFENDQEMAARDALKTLDGLVLDKLTRNEEDEQQIDNADDLINEDGQERDNVDELEDEPSVYPF